MTETEKLFTYFVGNVPNEGLAARLIFFPLMFLCVVGVLKYSGPIEMTLPGELRWISIFMAISILTVPFFLLGWLIYGNTPIKTKPGMFMLVAFALLGLFFGGFSLSFLLVTGYLSVIGSIQLAALPIVRGRTIFDSIFGWPILLSWGIFTAPVFFPTIFLFPLLNELFKRIDRSSVSKDVNHGY